jgi:hypothetical protein
MKYLLLALMLISCSTPKKQPVKPTPCTYGVWKVEKDTIIFMYNIPCDYFKKNK